ncbi:ankyrin repeat protein [Colletotrichum truncatum]|uniref:Ankyrin repeat protein n=1 Tax=Colletotrichum truncatum TaxID=5467 RepID=A0ACC3ZEL2_COLTU|nr:ankyrin repeat protein [Colletotrichum truncatum]KAF6794916.1 ankyrin repeat protein [Colletotrichum truncatum]
MQVTQHTTSVCQVTDILAQQYAFENSEICRFLVQHGADVDDVAYCDHIADLNLVTRAQATPLFLTTRSSSCYIFEHLLMAGADPTIEAHLSKGVFRRNRPLWRSILFSRSVMSYFGLLIKLRGDFIDINEVRKTGGSMLHECCLNSEFDAMRTLIDHGATVDARDDRGCTSLQYLVSHIRLVGGSIENDQRSLVYLIESGADISSRDDGGWSIWDTAVRNRRRGSYARDMWDFALAYSGYHSEMEAFLQDHPRHASYCRRGYSRTDFESMWEGMEHMCPYYEHEDLGLDSASVMSSNQPESSPSFMSSDTEAQALQKVDSGIYEDPGYQQTETCQMDAIAETCTSRNVMDLSPGTPRGKGTHVTRNSAIATLEEVYLNPWAEG